MSEIVNKVITDGLQVTLQRIASISYEHTVHALFPVATSCRLLLIFGNVLDDNWRLISSSTRLFLFISFRMKVSQALGLRKSFQMTKKACLRSLLFIVLYSRLKGSKAARGPLVLCKQKMSRQEEPISFFSTSWKEVFELQGNPRYNRRIDLDGQKVALEESRCFDEIPRSRCAVPMGLLSKKEQIAQAKSSYPMMSSLILLTSSRRRCFWAFL